MTRKILVLNGPNLNLLGSREVGIYGTMSLADIQEQIETYSQFAGVEFSFEQSNHEGQLVDYLHDARNWADGVVLNAGAYTHTSIALHDAIMGIQIPVVEIHISNIHAREAFRQHSYLASVCIGQISGFGRNSYILGVQALILYLDQGES